ncbi:MAG: BrnA antitoxin family protein [Pyrinomonadaceae bacterium]
MSERNLKKPSETDWARIDSMTDEEIDTSDIPPLDAEFFATAQWRMPKRKTAVTLSVDDDVLKWFEAQGAEFQQRINAALRIYAEAHQE